jgi:hypothetical protein
MEEMGLYLWSVWPAFLVLLGLGCQSMGHLCAELSLYLCLDARISVSLDARKNFSE